MKKINLNHGEVALVDDADFKYLNQFTWYTTKGYVVRSNWKDGKQGTAIRMHNDIMNPPSDKIVDHINGNGLDNRRSNLRICTWAQNLCNKKIDKRNKTGYKGVYNEPEGSKNPYRAMIGYDHKLRYIGLYATAEDAARAYNDAARELHGEFARLNKV